MFEVINQWQQSGLTQKAWCEQNNIAYGTFHYWYKLYRSQALATNQDSSEGFLPLLADRLERGRGAWCEPELPDGKKLVFHQPVGADLLRTLIE